MLSELACGYRNTSGELKSEGYCLIQCVCLLDVCIWSLMLAPKKSFELLKMSDMHMSANYPGQARSDVAAINSVVTSAPRLYFENCTASMLHTSLHSLTVYGRPLIDSFIPSQLLSPWRTYNIYYLVQKCELLYFVMPMGRVKSL